MRACAKTAWVGFRFLPRSKAKTHRSYAEWEWVLFGCRRLRGVVRWRCFSTFGMETRRCKRVFHVKHLFVFLKRPLDRLFHTEGVHESDTSHISHPDFVGEWLHHVQNRIQAEQQCEHRGVRGPEHEHEPPDARAVDMQVDT